MNDDKRSKAPSPNASDAKDCEVRGTRCPVEYPRDPVDGYELTWWAIQDHSVVEVLPHRSVYKAKATWDEAVPERAGENGAPFEDEWMVFWRGKFTGRNVGWNTYREPGRFEWRHSYATEEEALDAAILLTRETIAAHRATVEANEAELKKLTLRRHPVQLSHDTGEMGGLPCRRCGIRYSQRTAYLPCFLEGDDLKTWVARNADTIVSAKGYVPDLLHEMAIETRGVQSDG